METEKKGIIQQLIELGLITCINNEIYICSKENIPTPPTKAE